jgi:Leucine Rich repeat
MPELHLVLPLLSRSRLVRRLRVLELSGGDLTDEDLPELLGAAEDFRHLAVLDLSRNQLSAEACKALRGLCAGQVLLDGQRSAFDQYGDIERSVDDELASERRYDDVEE